jgi:DNA (cytosine-5)-methyltransferase 1
MSILFNQDDFYRDSSGLMIPKTCLPEKRLIAMDFFSGIGGFSLGLIQDGINVIAAVEWDIAAVHTYSINLGAYPLKMIFVEESDRERAEKYFQKLLIKKDGIVHTEVSGNNRHKVCPAWFKGVKYIFVGDVRKLSSDRVMRELGIKPGELDLMVGGPPCQGFSRLGKRNVMDPRNSLVFEYARFISEMKPKSLVMENVPNIVNMVTQDGIPIMDEFCRILEDGGFGVANALKKSLTLTAGAGGAFKATHSIKKNKKKTVKKRLKNKEEQLNLF